MTSTKTGESMIHVNRLPRQQNYLPEPTLYRSINSTDPLNVYDENHASLSSYISSIRGHGGDVPNATSTMVVRKKQLCEQIRSYSLIRPEAMVNERPASLIRKVIKLIRMVLFCRR